MRNNFFDDLRLHVIKRTLIKNCEDSVEGFEESRKLFNDGKIKRVK